MAPNEPIQGNVISAAPRAWVIIQPECPSSYTLKTSYQGVLIQCTYALDRGVAILIKELSGAPFQTPKSLLPPARYLFASAAKAAKT